MIHRKLKNVVYMKKIDAKKKKKKKKGGGGVGNILKKNKGSNIGSCPQVPVGHIKVIVYQYGNKTTGEAYVTLLTNNNRPSLFHE